MAPLQEFIKGAESRKQDIFNQKLNFVSSNDNSDNMVSWFTSPFKNLKARSSTGGSFLPTCSQSNNGISESNRSLTMTETPTLLSSDSRQHRPIKPSISSIDRWHVSPNVELHGDSSIYPALETNETLNGIIPATVPATEVSDETSGSQRTGSTPSKSSGLSSSTSLGTQFVKTEADEDGNLLHTLNSRVSSSSPLSSQLSPAKSTTPAGIRPSQPAKPAKTSTPRTGRINFAELRPRTSIPQNLSPAELAQQSIHAAYSSRLNPFAFHPHEYRLLRNHICHSHVTAYLNVRNRILRLWVRNPLVGVTPDEAAGCAMSSRWLGLAEVAYEWLVRNGYINFGCVEVPDSSHLKTRKVRAKKSKPKTIVVIGAGMAGLGCARQLEGLFRQYHWRLSLLGEDPPKVVLLEGRNRIGGRVYSHPLRNQESSGIPEHSRCVAEMGAHIITGFDHGNPLNMIIRGQLGLYYHPLKDNSTLYDLDGHVVDKTRDSMVEKLYNDILDRASVYRHRTAAPMTIEGDKLLIEAGRDPLGEPGAVISATESERLEESERPSSSLLESVPGGMDKLTGKAHMITGSRKKDPPAIAAAAMGWKLASNVLEYRDLNLDAVARSAEFPTLGAAMDEAVKQYQFLLNLSPLDMRLINWHYANMEYANAVNLGKLSLSGWDQDAGNEFEGEHAQVIGGYQQVPRGILQYPAKLDLQTKRVVKKINYNTDGHSSGRARVRCENGEVFEADHVVLTTPLGILKEKSVRFEPPLPPWKTGPIQRLGFGTLNKIVLVYNQPFWDVNQDMFGLLRQADIADSLDQEDYVVNRGKYYLFWNCIKTSGRPVLIALMAGDAAVDAEEASDADLVAGVTRELERMFKDTRVPMPSETIVTRWGTDRFARGTYSYVGATSLPGDYEVMARPIGNLHFAGEATCGTHPATVHGAYISGLRAASEIIEEMLGPIEIPSPLVPSSSKVDTSPKGSPQKRKVEEREVFESESAKKARLDTLEHNILQAIFGEIGYQPTKPGKTGSNPFLIFTKDKWEECKDRCNTTRRAATGNPNAKATRNEIRSAVGQMWREASDEVKRPYQEQTTSNRQANTENAATFEQRLSAWDERAREIRRKYLEDHPGALSAEEERSMWQALGVYETDRQAKKLSGYADNAGSERGK